MGYAYLSDFPQTARSRIEAMKIRTGIDLEDCKRNLRRISELEGAVRNYILRVFSAFAQEALELGRQGLWSPESIDREVREFLECLTLEAQLFKGHDLEGRGILPLTDRIFGRILPEVRREFEASNEWASTRSNCTTWPRGSPWAWHRLRRDVGCDRRGTIPSISAPTEGPNSRPELGRRGHLVSLRRTNPGSDRGRPETYNYAEFGCVDRRSERPNTIWALLKILARADGKIPDTNRTHEKSWPAIEKQVENLRKLLRDHFNLADDPLPFRRGTGYRLRCHIGCSESFHN